MINVLIADDQRLLRESLSYILGSDEDVNVVGLAKSGEAALKMCGELIPDIVLMDIEMIGMNGVDATKAIKEKYPNIKIIMLTTFETSDNIMEAFLNGADGYIVKNVNHRDLLLTVKCVAAGLTVIHESVKEIMLLNFKDAMRTSNDFSDLLSEKEIEIMKLIAGGKSNKEIAADLNYSSGTIKNYISKILGKLELTDRIQIAIFTIENGLLQEN